MFALRIPKGVNKTATAFCHYRPSFLPNRPTSEERLFPVRARLLRVTQKVSSNSIHTLLCSDEHKNPPSGGLRENRFQPQHKAERFVLSFGCKAEASETTFQEPKPPNVAIPTTLLPFQAEAIQPIFSYRRNQCTTIGLDSRRSAGTDRQAAE
jgi:hypothetical protein